MAKPFAYIEGKADRDSIFSAILGSLGLVKSDMEKAGLKAAGPPLAIFVGSDDSGFRYHAGYPLASAPEGKTSLSDAVKIGETPTGKAMRFQHLGAYADIDATYDAITAYLDEKGIDAQDTFIEEYPNRREGRRRSEARSRHLRPAEMRVRSRLIGVNSTTPRVRR